jgi:hypothetical protein
VKACELVLRLLSDVSRERSNSFWIAGFELGRSIQIALGRGVVVLLAPERLEGPQRFGLAPQDQVAYWAPAFAVGLQFTTPTIFGSVRFNFCHGASQSNRTHRLG